MAPLEKSDLTAEIAVLLAEALGPLHDSMRLMHAMLEAHMPAAEVCCCVTTGNPQHSTEPGAGSPPRASDWAPASVGQSAPSDENPDWSAAEAEHDLPVNATEPQHASVTAVTNPSPSPKTNRSAISNLADASSKSAIVLAAGRDADHSGTYVGKFVSEELAKGRLDDEQAKHSHIAWRLIVAWANWWEHLEEPPRAGCLYRLVSSRLFGCLSSSAILFNSVFVAFTSDYTMQHLSQPTPRAFSIIEWSVLGWFTLELLLRIGAHRLYFFVNEDMAWNIGDSVLVAISLVDALPLSSDQVESVAFMRTLRLLKLAKIVRALRLLKVFRALSQIMKSFQRSVMSLLWVFLMVLFIIYVGSLFFMHGVAEYLTDAGPGLEERVLEAYSEAFGTLPRAAFSLFAAVAGGRDWVETYELLVPPGSLYSYGFVGFVFIFVFAIFSILTGILVERAVASARPAREEQMLETRRAMIEEAAQFRRLCGRLDLDNSGTLSMDEFMKSMKNPTLVAYLASVGLEIHDVKLFFHIIAGSTDSTEVDIDMFVEGCMTMRGQATALDMRQQLFYSASIMRRMKSFEEACMEKLERIIEVSHRLLCRTPTATPTATPHNPQGRGIFR